MAGWPKSINALPRAQPVRYTRFEFFASIEGFHALTTLGFTVSIRWCRTTAGIGNTLTHLGGQLTHMSDKDTPLTENGTSVEQGLTRDSHSGGPASFPTTPELGANHMAIKLLEYTTQRVKLAEIQVDPDLNSRKGGTDEKDVAELAADIKVNGPIHPPVLIKATAAGGKYLKDAISKPFVLVAGFRRMAAYGRLGVEAADFRLTPDTFTLKETSSVNLAENLAREDLSPYEIAFACRRLRDDYKMTAADIGKSVRAHAGDSSKNAALSEGFVNNLIRCTYLHPTILKAWQERNAAASLRTLIDIAALKSQDKQLAQWEEVLNPSAGGDDEGGEGGEGGGEGSTSTKRPSATKVSRAMEFLKDADVSDEFRNGALAAFKFCQGANKTFMGQKFDKRVKAADDDADAGAEAGE